MEDDKRKNIDLPPSGLPDDLSTIGIRKDPRLPPPKKMGAPIAPWKAFLIAMGMIAGLAFLGSLLPKKPVDAVATQYAAMTSQAAAKTDVALVSTRLPTKTITPYPDITMTPTATHTFDEEEASLKKLPAVETVEFIKRRGTDYWASVTVWPKMNKEGFAQLIEIQAIHVDVYTFRFAVKIDDGESDPLWWIDENSKWRSSAQPPAWVDLEESGATSIPQPSGIKAMTPKTYYVQATANVRTCERLNCGIVATLRAGDEVTVDGAIEGEMVQSSARWYHVNINGTEGYIYNNLLDIVKPATTSNSNSGGSSSSNNATVVIPQTIPTASEGFVCPSNCTEAQAMGVSAVDAANCGLDRDGDGVACYGD